ncbi:ATPase [Mesorhizobium sp. LSJC285A00]|uniref:KAP family P-loop NTPase fold protein n=1 Tax=Mesorhizobium sp. LSJC285A00 TaxID=1287338 RepID=UPI0003CE0A39|nr:P-loop NTPase fold protein [Mesorhizobium sp. LSJC285A00]ESW84783.1 ATPase [Mesorhizobium sp. LSJC285A00]
MWSDNETDRDFLNFRYVADIAAEMIAQADGRPLSLGVSGSWGVGKSSMMKLLAQSLREKSNDKFLFVEFNAWLYQGFDDTRAALMEIIARAILARAEEQKGTVGKAVEKAKGLLARVNWFRLASVSATTVASLAVGLPPIGLLAEGLSAFKGLFDGSAGQKDIDQAADVALKAAEGGKGLMGPAVVPAGPTPPQAIHDFRDALEDTLRELDVTLVVLIDDLDRCLPPAAIATLEAMRLFLFLKKTAFVIAADDAVIREAVRAHFKGMTLNDDLVTNYFDKLIQVPIRVPPLGTQDVRAYLMMLFVENSTLPQTENDKVRTAISERLGETWTGKRVDRAFVASQISGATPILSAQLDLADRIAPILTTSSKIAGNPRLIKRFLNTLSIRMSMARAQKVSVDETALAKMLLFERCGSEKAYAELLAAINESSDGKPVFLAPWEEAARKNAEIPKLEGDWNSEFVREWLALQPPLADLNLQGVVYVSREHTPIITAADRLSSEGAELLEAVVKLNAESAAVGTKLKALPAQELGIITERILGRSRTLNTWGTPNELFGLLTLAQATGEHVQTITRFLAGLPGPQLTAAIVPLLADKPWATSVLSGWASKADIKDPVKRAIAAASKKAGK